jgi:hypothetical protein
MNTEQRAREILAEVTGAHVETIADFANDTSGGVAVTVPDALRAIIRALSPPASANPNAGKPELCGCGLPAEYMTNDGGWCCNKYGIKHLPASAGEGFVVSKASIDALVAGPFMHHHKMNELQEAQAKGFDRCREMTLKNIEVFFAARDAMLAAAPTPPAAEDARDKVRLDWLEASRADVFRTMSSDEFAVQVCDDLDVKVAAYKPTLRAAIDAAMLTIPDSGKEGDRG